MHGTTWGHHIRRKTLVILHVPSWQLLNRGSLELAEKVLGKLPKCINQYIQSTSMGHSNNGLLNASLTRFLEQMVKRDDHTLPSLQGEPLLTHVFRV